MVEATMVAATTVVATTVVATTVAATTVVAMSVAATIRHHLAVATRSPPCNVQKSSFSEQGSGATHLVGHWL